METIKIKGKDYVTVNERIKEFWKLVPSGKITTEILSNSDGVCVFKASVYNGESLLATGHAYEREDSTFINKTSYIENCETSAVGRALGMLGIGIDTSIASAEEVGNAISNQKELPWFDQKSMIGLKENSDMFVDGGHAISETKKKYRIRKEDQQAIMDFYADKNNKQVALNFDL